MKTMIERIVPFVVNDVAMPSFLCTPEALDELAVGNLITQGHIQNVQQIESVRVQDLSVQVKASGVFCEMRTIEERIEALSPVSSARIFCMEEAQMLMRELTQVDGYYGTHCIALKTPRQTYFREDIGRHNAMDKVIGRAALSDVDFSECVIAATGRISLEMLLKAACVGIPIIISKKYPSDLSIEIANRLSITIIGNATTPAPIQYAPINSQNNS